MFKRGKHAAVLGCGPAGLFATHALIEAGWDVVVYSNKRRSEMFGAQYLHNPIHGLTEISTVVNYTLKGSIDGYQRKVYGNTMVDSVSPESLLGFKMAWDIRKAYGDAWDTYHSLIQHSPGMGAAEIKGILDDGKGKRFRLVVSSLPAPSICHALHRFVSKKIWAVGDAPERGVFCPVSAPTDTVVCNGEIAPGWYRASNVFGYKTAEWPEGNRPPIDGIAEVFKPIKTDCTCWSEEDKRFIRVGRYGKWTKGVYAHDAYLDAKEMAR